VIFSGSKFNPGSKVYLSTYIFVLVIDNGHAMLRIDHFRVIRIRNFRVETSGRRREVRRPVQRRVGELRKIPEC
jgi:hypothetical protein